LSLLAYCYYYIQDFINASDCYEQLTQLCPDQDHYKLYYAQCLYKCGFDVEAMRACEQIENQSYKGKVIIFLLCLKDDYSYLFFKIKKLQSAIQYEKDELKASLVSQ
jgi:hypothetical protein